MSHWNYRLTREAVEMPDGTTEHAYALREVYYDDEGVPNGWTKEPASFAGDTPGEVVEALTRAAGAWPQSGVLDLDSRQTVRVTYHGKEKP